MHIAFDDTDSVQGGCTTYTALELTRRLPGIDIIGYPRLVRLNPNVPHKTRGNGAVAIQLGHGRGSAHIVGHDGSHAILGYPEGDELSSTEEEHAFAVAQRLIQETARLDDPKTHPGLVMTPSRPRARLYKAAVRRYVGLPEAVEELTAAGTKFVGWKAGRGVLGAAAALAWPGKEGTYEWIAYRAPDRWGTPRTLDASLGAELDAHHPSTFDNWDPLHDHLRVAPASPCPVLAGIRGTDAEDLHRAAQRLGPETARGALLFATNQATDDHFSAVAVAGTRSFTSPTLHAKVLATPVTVAGGHVFVRVADETGRIDLAAFEPTKEFRQVVRALRPGDALRAHGGTHTDPTLVSLEKLELLDSPPSRREQSPDCSSCGGRMKNRGRDAPRRCPRCRTRAPSLVATEAGARIGAYEVPVAVRRHLTRPLKLDRLARFP